MPIQTQFSQSSDSYLSLSPIFFSSSSSIQNGLNETSDLQNPSSKLALIVLYQSMLKHADGTEWLKQEQAWKRAVNYCLQDQTIYVVRRASEFVTDFLFHIADAGDDKLCMEMIAEISRPINDHVYKTETQNVNVESSDLDEKVSPSLNIIRIVLDRFIHLNKKSPIGSYINQTVKNAGNMWKLTDMTFDHVMFGRILQCLIYMCYAALVDKLNANENGGTSSVVDFNDFGLGFLNLCKFCILKNQNEALVYGARLYYTIWKSLGDRVPEEIILGNQLTKFENQAILFQILPLFGAMELNDECAPELLEDYFMKLFNISTEHTIRIGYLFRNSAQAANVDIYDLSCKAIQGILSIIDNLHRDRAVIVFQALCHVIRRIRSTKGSQEYPSLLARPRFMSSVLSGLYTIVKNYRITWKDSYESVGLLNCMLYAIEDPNLNPRVCRLIR